MTTTLQDITTAFGPLHALIAKRKRLVRERDAASGFRWHAMRIDRQLQANMVDIRFALFIPTND